MRVAMLLATNERYLPHCRVAIASVLEHAAPENEYLFYIFHGGMPEKALALLRAMGRENARVEPVCVRDRLHGAMRELLWYTKEIYFRLMAADALPGEDKLLYMDCDVIALEDVAHLYAEDIGDALLGAYIYPGREADMNAALGTDVQGVFNSGVLLFNLHEWRKISLFERCMEVLERYPSLPCPDQDALAIVCSGRVAPLDHRWNLVTMPPNRHGLYANGIAHMAAAAKPWSSGGDTNYAWYYSLARRLGSLPPVPPPPQDWPGASWANRRFGGLRPAWLREMVRRASGAAWLLASACLPGRGRYLRRVRVAVTRRCPAACEHCETLCPQCADLPEIDADQLIASLARLFAHTRTIRELTLTGGEPLARPELARVLRYVLNSGHASLVVVETPGLAEPAPELLPLLNDERVYVQNHGSRAAATPAPRSKADPDERWVWADFGPLERRDCTDEQLYWQVRACGADDWYYLDGRLWPCARMACAVALGRVPESACVFADLRGEKSRLRTAQALEKLTQPRPMEACRYCLRGTVDFRAVPPEV